LPSRNAEYSNNTMASGDKEHQEARSLLFIAINEYKVWIN
jgi:hypothetical protein